MFDAIANFFRTDAEPSLPDEPKLAVAALLVHLAGVDGQVDEAEKLAVRGALQDFYGMSEDDVRALIREARKRDADAVDFYRFTSALRELDSTQRIEIVRMMWQVVFADKKNHELEDNMVWRIAELIGVSARDRTALRKQMSRS
ncbi:MAG: TerB family tellurite resistance protein [Devosia sp.]